MTPRKLDNLLTVILIVAALLATGRHAAEAAELTPDQVEQLQPTQAQADELRETIRVLEDQAKAIKDASDDAAVQTDARAIERLAGVAKTLGVELDSLIEDGPADPPVIEPPVVIEPGPTDPPTAGGWLARDPGTDAVTVQPGQSIADAIDTGRDVLLVAGAGYTLNRKISMHDGQLLGVVGDGARPIIDTAGYGLVTGTADDVTIAGVYIHSPGRDAADNERGIYIQGDSRGWLIEDCLIVGYAEGITIQGDTTTGIDGVTVSRCILRDQHADGRHSQGMFTTRAAGVVVRETVIDHSGWSPDHPEQRTKFNHGIYADDGVGTHPIVVEGCYISRSSSHGMQGRAGATVTDTIFDGNAIGAYLPAPSLALRDVVLRSDDIPGEDAPRGWGLQAYGEVRDNVIAHRASRSTRQGLEVGDVPERVTGNVVFDWLNSKGEGIKPAGIHDASNVQDDDPDHFVDASKMVTDAQREAWLTRPRGVVPDIAQVCAWIRAGYEPRQ